MRVLFTTFAAKSHFHSQVSMAWALRSAGHDVRVASQPDLAQVITSAGLTAVPVGEPLELDMQMDGAGTRPPTDYDQEPIDIEHLDITALSDITELHPEMRTYEYRHTALSVLTNFVFRTLSADTMMDDLVEFARQWRPDLVLWEPMTFAGSVAAMASGAAHGRLQFGLDLIGRTWQGYVAMAGQRPPELRDDPLEEWLGWSLERYGCRFSEEAVLGQWTIDPFPSAMRLDVDHQYVPMRYVPYNGPATIPDWLREPPKRRRICVTLGISFREVLGGDRASIADLLEAVADLDAEVVATLNADQLADLPTVPDNVRALDFVPLDALLPTCSAIVHHGGFGTFQTAMSHGVPQIVVPVQMWDTTLKARRLAELGAGLYVDDIDGFHPRELHDLLTRVMDEPSFAANAARLRREVQATPSPSDIVPVLERLTDENSAARP